MDGHIKTYQKTGVIIARVFTTTIDYPYLVWCLENGVNVLFTVCGKMMYFRLV